MKKISVILLVFGLSWASGSARAATGGEVAIVAGAAAAASILGPVIATATTKSEVTVTVEMYRETYLLRPPGVSWAEWEKLPLEKQRTEPFRLGGPTVLKQMRDSAAASDALTPAKALELADRLAGSQADFRAMVQQLEKTMAIAQKWAKGGGAGRIKTFAPILQDLTARRDAAQRSDRAITAFRDYAAKTPLNLLLSSNLLEQVRDELRRFPSEFVPKSAQLFYQLVAAGMVDDTTILGGTTNGVPVEPTDAIRLAQLAQAERVPFPANVDANRQIATTIAASLQLLRDWEAKTNQFEFDHHIIKVDVQAARKGLDEGLAAFGFLITSAELKDVTSTEVLVELIAQRNLAVNTTKIASQTLALTFMGVAVGANFGPVVNEVFQGVYARSRMLDTIFSDTPGHSNRWVVVNSARSSGEAGDHNAVIYFDNILNPVLKTASFDPSQFIAAHGKLYRRAMSVMTDMFGVPLPPAAGGTSPPSPVSGLNLYDPQARVLNAQNQGEAQKTALRETLKELIDTMKEAQADAGGVKGWKDADTGTNRITTVRSKLKEFALKLESTNNP